MESELVCVDAYGKFTNYKELNTNDPICKFQGKKAGLGELSGGFLFSVPLHSVRKLLSPTSVLLKKLGETIKFEIAIGMNGRIWIRASNAKETIAICKLIFNNSISKKLDNHVNILSF